MLGDSSGGGDRGALLRVRRPDGWDSTTLPSRSVGMSRVSEDPFFCFRDLREDRGRVSGRARESLRELGSAGWVADSVPMFIYTFVLEGRRKTELGMSMRRVSGLATGTQEAPW